MSGSQKALKVISIITIVYAVVLLVLGIFMAAGGSLLSGETIDVDGTAASASIVAAVLGVTLVVGGVVDLVIGLLGLRGAKNPRKVGPFFVLCIIGLALGLVGRGMAIAQGTFDPASLVNIVIIAVCLFLAMRVKQQA